MALNMPNSTKALETTEEPEDWLSFFAQDQTIMIGIDDLYEIVKGVAEERMDDSTSFSLEVARRVAEYVIADPKGEIGERVEDLRLALHRAKGGFSP